MVHFPCGLTSAWLPPLDAISPFPALNEAKWLTSRWRWGLAWQLRWREAVAGGARRDVQTRR